MGKTPGFRPNPAGGPPSLPTGSSDIPHRLNDGPTDGKQPGSPPVTQGFHPNGNTDFEALRLIFVHDFGPQPPQAELKGTFDRLIFGRDLGDLTASAYWADVLRYGMQAPGVAMQDVSTAELRGRAMDLRLQGLLAPLDSPTDRIGGARQFAARFVEGVLDEVRRQHQTGPAIRGVDLAQRDRWSARYAIAVSRLTDTTPDLAAYLFGDDGASIAGPRSGSLAVRIRTRLEQLLATPRRTIVVGHGMGAVIAYDVLRSATRPVKLFVSLGAPLGWLRELIPDRYPTWVRPHVVEQWVDFCVSHDALAVRTDAPGERPDEMIRREIPWCTEQDDPGATNLPHDLLEYLESPEVRDTLRAAMGSHAADPIQRPFLALDVARQMGGDPERRQEVLIELIATRQAGDLATKRAALVRELEAVTGRNPAAGIDPLERYVAARLTTGEVMRLEKEWGRIIYRVWKNEVRRPCLDQSVPRIYGDPALTNIQPKTYGEGITWAVIDSGINPEHPHFLIPARPGEPTPTAVIESRWNCCELKDVVPDALTGTQADSSGHGTHVAGIIAGQSAVDAQGLVRYSGVAPRARLTIYRCLQGSPAAGSDSWVIKALQHIADRNEAWGTLTVHGVNLSLSGPYNAEVMGCGHSPICKELRRLWRQGVIVCVAAGNSGQQTVLAPQRGPGAASFAEVDLRTALSIGDPANLEECIAVGSVHRDQPHTFGVSYFSSRGPTADGRPKPDCVAPGERINSANSRFLAGQPDTHYVRRDGSSMACPHVSGLLAAFLSIRKEFIGRPNEVKRLLMSTAIDLNRDRYHQGAGLPSLRRMLDAT